MNTQGRVNGGKIPLIDSFNCWNKTGLSGHAHSRSSDTSQMQSWAKLQAEDAPQTHEQLVKLHHEGRVPGILVEHSICEISNSLKALLLEKAEVQRHDLVRLRIACVRLAAWHVGCKLS